MGGLALLVPPRKPDLPPIGFIGLLTQVRQVSRRLQPLAAARPAEAPELGCTVLVTMDQVIEFEDVNLAGVHPRKTVADVLEQPAELFFVVGRDDLSSGPTTRLVVVGPKGIENAAWVDPAGSGSLTFGAHIRSL